MSRTQQGKPPVRDITLDLLKKHRGEWVSGQLLAERLAITRAAIWKRVAALKEQGYGIDSSPRKGYCLRDVSNRLLASEIHDGLNTRIIGQRDIHHYDQTDSTNRRAKELAAAGAAEGVLVVAEEQTRGRGRLDRQWFSPAGQGIYASLILRPSLPPGAVTRMVLLTAVAVAETLRDAAGMTVSIKWPNDILAGGRKIAGILTEVAMEMDTVNYIVIGLGLNVNIPANAFPEDLGGRATSVLMETGKTFSRALLLRRFLESCEGYYHSVLESGFDPVMARWRALTDMEGKQVTVQTIGGTYTGRVLDFDRDGFLILQDNEGESIKIYSGDVTLR